MGFLGKLFKGPEIDMEKSNANAAKMRQLFNHVVEGGNDYRLIFGYTEEDVYKRQTSVPWIFTEH